jgi:peptidoglycan hydrolase CwlO-like protein
MKKRFKIQLFSVLALALLIATSMPLYPVHAQSIVDQKTSQLKEVQKKIDEQQKLLDAKKKEATSLQNQIDLLDGEIEQTKLDIEPVYL